jgi:UDP-galactopyranose mutase
MIDKQEIDLLIVGAGPVGCTIAERSAQVKGWKSLIIDKREHIAGNCHDCINSHGQLIHKYGPHYFRTSNEDVFSYLSKFTSWIPGNYIVKSSVKNKLYPIPINLSTLEKYFDQELDEDTALKLLHSLRVHKENPKNSEEFILSRLGKELYEDFYLGYTLKQWDIHPKDLDPSVCGRVPIRLNRDESYVNATHKVMPKDGFSKMFSRMIESKNIFFKGNTNFEDLKKIIIPKIATVYTGPVDEYFNYCLGRLPWRSLKFEWKTYKEKLVQPCVQINYPNDHKYTRSVEIKHVTKQNINTSTVSYEYPQSVGDPYYPVPQPASSELYLKYKQLAEEIFRNEKVYFVGRLAEYTYINTDEAIKRGLDAFQKIANSNGID